MDFMATDTSTIAFEDYSLPFIGRWTRLVSTTNWDKGLIIHQWRQALIEADAPAAEYSDDAWSRRVGGVSPQHVGRLRRVYDRFSDIRDQFAGLYWSHFQAAIDWDDAEMWLEGATQNDWSVAHMRKQRWEAMGAPADQRPSDSDDSAADFDEDAETSAEAEELSPDLVANAVDQVQEPRSPAGPDFGDEDDLDEPSAPAEPRDSSEPSAEELIESLRPFERLPDLPEDLQEAFEAFKVCIIKYKTDEWREVSQNSVVQTLDALRQFAVSR